MTPMQRAQLRALAIAINDLAEQGTIRAELPELTNVTAITLSDGILDLDIDSGCGKDCYTALVSFNELVAQYPDVKAELRAAVVRLLNVYYHG